jgi:hypothetical protein
MARNDAGQVGKVATLAGNLPGRGHFRLRCDRQAANRQQRNRVPNNSGAGPMIITFSTDR